MATKPTALAAGAAIALAGAVALAGRPAADMAEIAGVTLPQVVRVGGEALGLRGCGLRQAWWIKFYVAGLYAPRPDATAAEMLSAETAKAVYVHIVYDEPLPKEMPESWRRPLGRIATAEARETLIALYRGLKPGDRLTVAYGPRLGTLVTVNGKRLARSAADALMRPLSRPWIGEEAVTAELREALPRGRYGGAAVAAQ